MRALQRLRPRLDRTELDVLAVELRVVLRPDATHRFEAFIHHGPPLVRPHAVVPDSSGTHLAPTPNNTLLLESTSSVATARAVTIG